MKWQLRDYMKMAISRAHVQLVGIAWIKSQVMVMVLPTTDYVAALDPNVDQFLYPHGDRWVSMFHPAVTSTINGIKAISEAVEHRIRIGVESTRNI